MIIPNHDYENNLLSVYMTMPGSDRVWHPMSLLKWTNKEEFMSSAGCASCGNVGAPTTAWRYLVTEDVLGNTFSPMFCSSHYVYEKSVTAEEIAELKGAPEDYYGNHPNNRSTYHRDNAVKRAFTRHFVWSDNSNLKTFDEALEDGDVLTPSNPVSPVPPKDTIKRIYER